MRALDWYFDFISPYAYLQSAQFPALPDDMVVRIKPVLFGALLDKSGTLGPAEIPGKREHTYRQVLWLAQTHGIDFKMPPRHPFNPLPALRLAASLDADLETVQRIFRFIWAEGRDPSDPREFAALAKNPGCRRCRSARRRSRREGKTQIQHRSGNRRRRVGRSDLCRERHLLLGLRFRRHAARLSSRPVAVLRAGVFTHRVAAVGDTEKAGSTCLTMSHLPVIYLKRNMTVH